jgi:hypothetical protein
MAYKRCQEVKMKKITGILVAVLLLVSASAFAQEKKSIGLTLGMDYYSTYLFRGMEWMNGEGAFAPYISYDIMGTGLVVSLAAELAQNQTDAAAVDGQSIDFGLDYSYTFADLVTLSAGAWYWLYPEKVEDFSFLTLSASVGFEVPLNPTVSYTHDFYFGIDEYTDFYLTASIGHEFELPKGVALGLGLSYGMYHIGSADDFRYLNDITASISLGFNVAGVDISGSLNGMYVPDESAIFKTYATVGASYTF